ncbi:hypothetical protein [Streptomyces sp. BE230]|uniref:hypothetical protein n=1 Tax=Streptomyces sp. BE230 TaxID=3002526 RepID=UPI002ED035D0|nr:hypothetical protein [Streptomyces sp. BE230]
MGFSDITEPTAHLTPPKDPTETFNPVKLVNQAADLISPTYWVNEILNMALGFNPMDKTKEYFAGDWEAYAKCGEVWQNLGKLCVDVSKNIDTGNLSLDRTWDGNAADAAYVYFKDIAARCDDLQSELDALKTEYAIVSQGVWAAAEAVGSIIGTIGDTAAVAAIAAAAGTMMSWTGWGAAVGYGLAAVEIIEIIELWGKATATLNKCQLITQGSLAIIASAGGTLATKFADFPLPSSAYDNPVV